MIDQELAALSPLDGRYRARLELLAARFSEAALMRARVAVELAYLAALLRELGLPPADLDVEVGPVEAREIKRLEAETNHDVKAVEYFLRGRVAPELREYVHLGLTSEDVNNLAYARMLAAARAEVLLPALARVVEPLTSLAAKTSDLPMLARTHGQPASPTTMGKELGVFLYRLTGAGQALAALPLEGKLAGATGTLGAHAVAFPGHDWPAFARGFVAGLGLVPLPAVAQSDPHDGLATLCDAYARLASVGLDLCQDLWRYVSDGWFRLAAVASEVGSSAMPHKVNPIDFENAEGNLGLARALFGHCSAKLPISRLQRDLSDSTVLRNLGVAQGHLLLGLDALARGLAKLAPDEARMRADLAAHPEVLAEAYQVALRAAGRPASYEALKALTRDARVQLADLHGFLDGLDAPAAVVSRLRALTPADYTGHAPEIARTAVADARQWLEVLS